LRAFDALRDFDTDGCSISLDLDIEELVANDFGDHTVWLLESDAPVKGVGFPARAPATARAALAEYTL
jgi:hypothetical protein